MDKTCFEKIPGHVQFVAKYIPYVGGGEVQFLKTADALRELGVEVETAPASLRGFPAVVHFFGSHGNLFNDYARALKERYRIPYVVSTIFYPSPRGVRNVVYAGISKFLIRRNLECLIPGKGFRELPYLLRNADMLLPNTAAEAEILKTFFPFIKDEKIMIVPNGVEDKFEKGDEEVFRCHFKINYDFVLNVARLEPRKNQLRLIRALKGTGIKLVIVGNKSVYPDYARECFNEGGEDVFFAGELSHDDSLLAGAYAAAKVFALPSSEETPGISAMEAALAGAAVVITERGGTKEYYKNYVKYVDPISVDDIRNKIIAAWEEGANIDGLKNLILANYSWSKVAQITREAYLKVIGNNNNR